MTFFVYNVNRSKSAMTALKLVLRILMNFFMFMTIIFEELVSQGLLLVEKIFEKFLFQE